MGPLISSRATGALPAVLLLVLGLCACGSASDAGAVPAPDLDGMSPAIRQFLEEERGAVIAAPSSPDAWGRYGMALQAHDLLDLALECYRKAAETESTDGRWPYLIAGLLERSGAPPEAVLAEVERSIARSSGYAPVHYRRGVILAGLGRPEEARAAFELALGRDPQLAAAHRELGQQLLGLEDFAAAREHLEQAETLAPGDPAVATALAQCFAGLGDHERASAAAEAARLAARPIVLTDRYLIAVERLARTPERSLERGLAALEARNAKGACADLAITLEANPDDGLARDGLGRALLALGRHTEAYQELARASQILGDAPERHRSMARCQLAMGKPGFAVLLIERAIELAPEDLTLAIDRATFLAHDERFAESEQALSLAALRGPLAPEALVTWGDVARVLERFEEAREHYLAAAETWPNRLEVLYGLGLAEEGMGLMSSAAERYRAVLLRQPKHPAGARLAALLDQGATKGQ